MSLGVAKTLGAPQSYPRCCPIFLCPSKKIHIGKFYGSEVLSCNSAVQGCSFSVLMIHSMYAILARSIDRTFPDISIATFVDDAKNLDQSQPGGLLVDAFHFIEQFDTDIVQSLDSKKSAVLAPQGLPKEYVESWRVPFRSKSKFVLWVGTTRSTRDILPNPFLKKLRKRSPCVNGFLCCPFQEKNSLHISILMFILLGCLAQKPRGPI